MEDLRNIIKQISGIYLDNLYKELSHYFIIKEKIYDEGVRRELNLPFDIILNKFGLKKETFFDPIYLPEQLELAYYIKENNFEFFENYHYIEYNYNHYEYGYNLREILAKLTPIIDMVKSQRIIEFEKQLSVNDKQKNSLNSIREQMKVLELEKLLEKNLSQAIKHFENGEFLASALISSRIIIHGINKIPSKIEENDEKFIYKGSLEEKIKFLREKGIIEKEERDKKLNIIKYAKKARDFLVHDIKRFPDASESMTLLGDGIDILKINKKLEDV